MPDDGYEYLVGMKNELSPQVREVDRSLDEMTSALKRSDEALRSHGRTHREAAGHVREHAESLHGAALGFTKSLLGLGGMTAAIAEGELLAHAFERAGELAREGIKFAVEASEFKENAVDAYSVVLGTAEEGERAFRALDKTAREIHMPTERAHEIAQRLMLEGLKSTTAVTDTVRAIGDLERTGLGAGAERLQGILARSLAAGHLELGRGPRALAGTGLSFNALAAHFNLSTAQFKAQLAAGKIDVEEGIAAIDSAIIHGKVGALATKKFTVSDAFTDLKNAIRGVFQETDSGPLVEALKEVTKQFAEGTENASLMREAFDKIMEGAGELIKFAGKIASAFSHAWDEIRDGADSVFDWITQHDPLLSDEFKRQARIKAEIADKLRKDVRPLVERRDEGIAALEEASAHGAKPSELKSIAKKYGLEIAAGKAEVEKAIKEHEKTVKTSTVPVVTASQTDEGGISIKSMRPSVETTREPTSFTREGLEGAGKDAAGSLEKGFRDENKQHSPSEVMMDLGAGAAESLQSGFAAAAERMRPREPASSGRQVALHVEVGGIHVQGVAHVDELLPLLESQVADIFERAALELGQ
jgi:hypothetical protein